MTRLDQRKLIQIIFLYINYAEPQVAGRRITQKNKAAGRRIKACIMWEYPIQ